MLCQDSRPVSMNLFMQEKISLMIVKHGIVLLHNVPHGKLKRFFVLKQSPFSQTEDNWYNRRVNPTTVPILYVS